MVTGTVELSKGTLQNAPDSRGQRRAVGDLILTAGSGGIFPGTGGGQNFRHLSGGQRHLFYAEITPMADIQSVRDVLVLTSFTGQRSAGGTGASELPADEAAPRAAPTVKAALPTAWPAAQRM